MQTPGKGQVLQHLRSPIPPRPTRGICLQSWDRAAHSPHPGLLPFPPLFPGAAGASPCPGAAGPQCGRGCGASPAPGKPRGDQTATGDGEAAAAVPARRRGDSGDKGSGVLSQLVAVLSHSPQKKTSLWCPRCGHQGV